MTRRASNRTRGKPRTRGIQSLGRRSPLLRTLQPSESLSESLKAPSSLTRRNLPDLPRGKGLRSRFLLKRELALALSTVPRKPSPPRDPETAGWQDGPLPTSYGRDRLRLLPIDPYQVHAYWELAPQMLSARIGAIAERPRRILRVYDVTRIDFDGTNANSVLDIELTPEAQNWYFRVQTPGRSLCADLGFLCRAVFVPLVRSNVAHTPPAEASSTTDERWVRPVRRRSGNLLLPAPAPTGVRDIPSKVREIPEPSVAAEQVRGVGRPDKAIERLSGDAVRQVILERLERASAGSVAGLSSDQLRQRQ